MKKNVPDIAANLAALLAMTLLITVSLFAVSCYKDGAGYGSDDPAAPKNDAPVALDDALGGMFRTMGEIYGPQTRSAKRTVDGATLFGAAAKGGTTRSTTARDVAWVVNFEEGGFAVLGARQSVPSVICITEDGLFDDDEVRKIAAEIASGKIVQTTNPVDFIKREVLMTAMAADAGVQTYNQNVEAKWSRSLSRAESDPVWSEWEDAYKTGPLLTTLWNQSFPYNKECPPDPTDSRQTSYSGCVAMALVQIIAHNKQPAPGDIDPSATSTWDEILAHHPNPSKTAVRTAVELRLEDDLAGIIHRIGLGVDMDYSYYNGSAASSAKAEAYLRDRRHNIEYNNVWRHIWYNANHLTEMHDKGLPVYISAAGDGGAHAWVIDGSVHQKRTRTTSQGTFTERRFMFHCNFGWGGTANGYYLSETFSPNVGPVATESGYDAVRPGTNGRFYNSQYQIIEYGL